ncbi:MAG: TIGR04076 family protein [Pseudomonadota bacterium]
MVRDPGIGKKIIATIKDVKGDCTVGHQKGDTFEISCHNSGGLCGFFYHDIFPSLSTFQFGGNLPWLKGDKIELECPDRRKLVTLTLERLERD